MGVTCGSVQQLSGAPLGVQREHWWQRHRPGPPQSSALAVPSLQCPAAPVQPHLKPVHLLGSEHCFIDAHHPHTQRTLVL